MSGWQHSSSLLAATAAAAAVFFGGGCSSIDRAYDRGVEAADYTLDAARVAYCDAATMGAVRREYGRDVAGLGDYLRACGWHEKQIEAWGQAGALRQRDRSQSHENDVSGSGVPSG